MGEVTTDHHEAPLLDSKASSSHHQLLDPPLKRTGNIWTALAHIITGVIGSGVLSLAWSMAQLGWIAGPLAMLLFASITLLSTFLLSNCYRSPNPEYGPTRNRSYLEAVHVNLGERSAWVCGLVVYTSLYGIGIAYTITSAISMRAIQRSNCYHEYGHEATCKFGDTYYMLIFGAAQIVMSQIPNFRKMQWLSGFAAIMSFAYSIIALALGLAKVLGNGVIKGSISGISTHTTVEKVWLFSQALGDIAFAYPYSLILIEIQGALIVNLKDTLKSPPPENETMKKASTVGICITTFFYLCCASFGYAAFGDLTPGNLLTGYGFYDPHWLIEFANACIVLHLVGGYQVYSQPLFAQVDKWFLINFPSSGFVNNEYTLELALFPSLDFKINFLRLCFRAAYVASTTAVAMMFPYFNQVLGVLGPLQFWPLSIYFPVEMYFVQRKVGAWTTKWIFLRIFSMVCLIGTLFALIGSTQGLVSARVS